MIPQQQLTDLHLRIEDACRRSDAGSLPVLGYGEISLVVAWPADAPRWAVKRLPIFPNDDAVAAYADVFHRYVHSLRDRGVDVLETDLQTVPGPGSTVTAYVVQPALPEDDLAHRRLAKTPPDVDDPILTHVIDRIASVVDDRVGLDAQFANWASYDGRLVYFDLTTPFMRDASGHWEVDGRLLATAVPWALRPALTRFVIPSIVARYHDRREVVLDVAVNLLRLRMDAWVTPLLHAAGERAGVHLSADDVHRDYRSERRTWAALQAVRRTDRAWQLRIRHRPYPFLIPERTGW